MSNRPRNYREALDFLNDRKDKARDYRVISTCQDGGKGHPVGIRDQLIAHTDNPLSTYGDTPPPISFRQWNTNIATFYPDGSIAVRPWDSTTTRDRMDDMNLPAARSPQSMGLTPNQTARLWYTGRFAIKGFPYGVPADRTYLLNSDRTLASQEDEPTETVYVESAPGVHARYNLGRRRVLKVLKQYHDMVVEMGVVPLQAFALDTTASDAMVRLCLSDSSARQLREEWVPIVLQRTTPETLAAIYGEVKQRLGLRDLTRDRELWTQKRAPSRELDQWL
jgi:hypothetical protein